MPPLGLALDAGYAIFLDYRADRYLLLEPALNEAVRRAIGGERPSPETMAQLAAALGQPLSDDAFAKMLVTNAPSFGQGLTATRSTARMKLAAVRYLASAFARLKLFGLHRSLRSIERLTLRSHSLQGEVVLLAQLAAAHKWLSRHFTVHDACLLRSMALARHAFAQGCAVRLVIGVKAHPFGAHCWVSTIEGVLNDDVDTVRPFAPIIAIP